MLVLSRKVEEQIVIPSIGITIQVVYAHRGKARLGIQAPRDIRILRAELPEEGGEKPADHPEVTRLNLSVDQVEQELDFVRECLQQNDIPALGDRLMEISGGLLKLNTHLLNVVAHYPQGVEPSEPAPPKGAESQKVNRVGKRILLVDDNYNESRLLASYLKIKGVEVTTAADGLQALQFLEKEPNPDAVLLDIAMPEYDGNWTIDRIRSNQTLKNLPVFAVSGTLEEETRAVVGPSGFNRWFAKPLDPELLVEAIDGLTLGK